MQLVSFPARQARTHYRHELRTLTYVTLDAANGGIVRNLNREGVAVQAVAPLRQEQRVRLRFELRFPRLRVETYGQVTWAGPSGQCGIRFVDLPSQTARQIDQWIFSNLLDGIEPEGDHGRIDLRITSGLRCWPEKKMLSSKTTALPYPLRVAQQSGSNLSMLREIRRNFLAGIANKI